MQPQVVLFLSFFSLCLTRLIQKPVPLSVLVADILQTPCHHQEAWLPFSACLAESPALALWVGVWQIMQRLNA